jgi:hypothetical protein
MRDAELDEESLMQVCSVNKTSPLTCNLIFVRPTFSQQVKLRITDREKKSRKKIMKPEFGSLIVTLRFEASVRGVIKYQFIFNNFASILLFAAEGLLL